MSAKTKEEDRSKERNNKSKETNDNSKEPNDKINEKDKVKEKYPLSINNQQCLTPCYYKNTTVIHPHTLDAVRNIDHSFCPVSAFTMRDPVTKQYSIHTVDRCIAPTARETRVDELFSESIIVPHFNFSSDFFVKVYYGILSLDDLLMWLDSHKNDPYRTKERVFNNGMIVYGEQLTIIDHRIVHHVNDIMMEKLPKIYKHLKKYITIVDDKIILIDPDNSDNSNNFNKNSSNDFNKNSSNDFNKNSSNVFNKNSSNVFNKNISDKYTNKYTNKYINDFNNLNESVSLIRSYIKSKFLGTDNVTQFMSKFVRYYKAEITERDLSKTLVDNMIEYCIKRIKMTLDSETSPESLPESLSESKSDQ
jgi:hypothetical protein